MNETSRVIIFLLISLVIHFLFLFAFQQQAFTTNFLSGKISNYSESIIAKNTRNVVVQKTTTASEKLAITLQSSQIKINSGKQQGEAESISTQSKVAKKEEVRNTSKVTKQSELGAQPPSRANIAEKKVESKNNLFISNIPPEYPFHDMVLNNQGTVTIMLTINKHGNVIRASLSKSSGFDSLDHRALIAVKKWRYNTKNRNFTDNYPVKKSVTIDFKIEG